MTYRDYVSSQYWEVLYHFVYLPRHMHLPYRGFNTVHISQFGSWYHLRVLVDILYWTLS